MINIIPYLKTNLKNAFNQIYNLEFDDKLFNVIFILNWGIDYSLKSLSAIQKWLQTKGINKTCNELYNDIKSSLDNNNFDIIFDRNCINFNLKHNYIVSLLQNVFNDLSFEASNKKKILVDFSSPNIAKDMHVGHLRSTIIGDSISKLFELQSHDVHRINHIGDFGLQFGMIIQYLLDTTPNYDTENLTISDLQNYYAKSKKMFDIDDDFKKKAYSKVVLLQNGDQEIVKAWNFIKDISRKSYNEIYERLDIKLDEVGESFYQDKIPELVEELYNKNLITEDNGRKIIKVDNFDVPLTIIKSDGGLTYDTTDLAAIKYRLIDLNMDEIIYVVDNGQSTHFELIFKVAKLAGWLKNHQKVIHVGFGLVLDANAKKFKSRNGDTVKLIDLLNESVNKASTVLNQQLDTKSNNRNLSEEQKTKIINNVAYGSLKYADLVNTRTHDYKFSFDKMLSFKGNTGVYQLYEYARICTILENAGEYVNNIDYTQLQFTEIEELNLGKALLYFPEVINKISDNLMFHNLCSYLYDLSIAFSNFHTKCRCLNYNINKELVNANPNRLALCIATKKIFEICFNILGINKLKRM
jgi:arginyl-tRNA synthetase